MAEPRPSPPPDRAVPLRYCCGCADATPATRGRRHGRARHEDPRGQGRRGRLGGGATLPRGGRSGGREATVLESGDERFSAGFWERDIQRRYFERAYHEVAFIIEGEVEITDDEGHLIKAGPGDILVTPKGSKGYWKSERPVKKFWTIYDEPDAELDAYIGPGPF